MPAIDACPDLTRYQDLLFGRVEAAENESLLIHLEQCDACARQVATLSAADTLLEAVGKVGTMSDGPEPQVVERLIERLLPWKGPSPAGAAADAATLPPVADGMPTVRVEAYDFLTPPEQPGELGRLGPYRVLGVLGSGGMGVVFLAEDPQLQRRVALKAMLPSLAASASATQRFLREARAAAAIEHEHIVSIYQVGEDRAVPYLAMQLLTGESLDERLQREGRLPAAEAARIGRQIASGLAAAHARGLMHRDIKPANIFLQAEERPEEKSECQVSNAEGAEVPSPTPSLSLSPSPSFLRRSSFTKVKILDFGLARGVAENSQLTGACLVGTPAYMAPEQTGGQPIDHRCDLFSLGCVLYRMTTGEAPFKGLTALETAIAVTHHQPPPPRTLRPDLPPALSDFIMRLLEKRPQDRPQKARDVAVALADIENAECRTPNVERVTAAQPRAQSPRRRIGWLIAAAVALLLAGPAIWFAPMVYRIATNQGELVVTVTDPKIEVLLKSEGVLVHNTATGDEYLVRPGAQNVRAGAYEIEVTDVARGLTFSAREFTIGRGGERQLAIALAASEPPQHGWPADAPPPAIAPFSAVQAKAHQEAWAKHLGVPVEYENSIGMKFVLIPPGEFLMGSTPAEIEAALPFAGGDEFWKEHIRSEAPRHKVILTQPIYLGVYEVTQAQYERVMGKNPSHFTATGPGKDAVVGLDTSAHPVEVVSSNDAAEFCAKLGEQEKLKPFYSRAAETVTMLEGTGYRLPTEAEWEFASRAGTTTTYWTGDREAQLLQTAWFGSNSDARTHAAGELEPNPFGLYDIHGNVWEWVQDWWQPTYYSQFEKMTALNPGGPSLTSARRVTRGGSWFLPASASRASFRNPYDPTARFNSIGFRVALSVDGVRAANTPPVAVAQPPRHTLPVDAPPAAVAPFDAEQAKAHQEAWAAHLGLPVEYTNSIGMQFVLIPPGEFTMGSTPEEIEATLLVSDDWHKEYIRSEAPQHKVILTQPVYLGLHEVTQAQYEEVMGQNSSHFAATGSGKDAVVGLDTATHPVESVNWNDAAEFCTRLSEKEKLKPFKFERRGGEAVTTEWIGYRLPTEAQWEFACRAGTTTKYWIGDQDQDLAQAGWFGANSGGRTHAVGELKENPFGLYDIHGNVWEWVQDWWKPNYYGQFQRKPALDPSGPSSAGSQRVNRDGSWALPAYYCRASCRLANDPTTHYSHLDSNLGFRVALSVEGVRATESPPASGAADAPADPDRRAAEWVLRIGGTVHVAVEGVDRHVEKPDELPAGEIKVTNVNLYPMHFQPAFRLEKLAGLRELTFLRLFATQITEVGVKDLKDLPKLQTLELDYNPGVTDAAVEHIGQSLTSLKYFNLTHTAITDRGLAHLVTLRELLTLNLTGTAVTDAGLSHLRTGTSIYWLALDDTKITDEGLGALAEMPALRKLELNKTRITDAGLKHLARFPKLREVSIKDTQVTEAGVAELQEALPELQVTWKE